MWHFFIPWLVFLPWSILFSGFLSSCFCNTLSKAHSGYLHLVRTFWRCFNLLVSSWELEYTALALYMRVLITLYLEAWLWLLSHKKYKLVWVGFLYTLVIKVSFYCSVMSVSRNGMEPSDLVSSMLNIMEGSTQLMCCKNSSLCDFYVTWRSWPVGSESLSWREIFFCYWEPLELLF